jgi:hypothetical protein
MFQIFSYFASSAIEASLIVVHVKCIIGELELIAVKKTQRKSRQVLQANALAQQRKELDAKTKQPIQMVDVIYTKLYITH